MCILARKEGVMIGTANLYIGGCSLERHYRNMLGDKREYQLEINGHSGTGFYTSIKEALLVKAWNYVTVQQASHFSFLLIHQTWGYESGSDRCINNGFQTFEEMFTKVKCCYDKAAEAIHADGIIPGGAAFAFALQGGISKIHRDTLHASLGLGRLILGMVWYGYLTGNSVDQICFDDMDEAVSEEEYRIAREAVKQALIL